MFYPYNGFNIAVLFCFSGSSAKSTNFLKVILRNSNESKKSKRRPLSTSEVEIFSRKDQELNDCKHPELKRSASRDSLGR